MHTIPCLLAAAALAAARPAPTPPAPAPPAVAAAALVEDAFSLASAVGDAVWPGWGAAPFDLVLVDGDTEYLVRSDQRPAGFAPVTGASLGGGPVFARPRTFPPPLLAAFPAFGATPVIVVGTPAATGRAPARWVLSVLHEHFHQLQYTQPGYYAAVEGLGLSGGDKTGMWMLEYAFPYLSPAVASGWRALAAELARQVEAGDAAGRRALWCRLAAFEETLAPRDRAYLEFQLWQEGIARYVELRVAERASARAATGSTVSASAAAEARRAVLASLREDRIESRRREAFYAFGAALGLLLDEDRPGWKEAYFRDRFSLLRLSGASCPR
jgi:hypothetical protein